VPLLIIDRAAVPLPHKHTRLAPTLSPHHATPLHNAPLPGAAVEHGPFLYRFTGQQLRALASLMRRTGLMLWQQALLFPSHITKLGTLRLDDPSNPAVGQVGWAGSGRASRWVIEGGVCAFCRNALAGRSTTPCLCLASAAAAPWDPPTQFHTAMHTHSHVCPPPPPRSKTWATGAASCAACTAARSSC
jgi:hypothetical protein